MVISRRLSYLRRNRALIASGAAFAPEVDQLRAHTEGNPAAMLTSAKCRDGGLKAAGSLSDLDLS